MHINTDLASELKEIHNETCGIEEESEYKGEIKITRIKITNDTVANKIGKKKGCYVTIDSDELEQRNGKVFKEVAFVLSNEIRRMISIDASSTILIVGLGNRSVTPDSLGPRVVSAVHVTRHLKKYMPEALETDIPGVCAIAPGVLGMTGIETNDIVKGIIENLKPDCIIAIDALASRRASRISNTIQLCDSGISPGSGVGNTRSELSRDSLGIPVIAIGVPLVVYASTIILDSISSVKGEYDEDKTQALVDSILKRQGDMIVTPKDIDTIIKDMAGVIAAGINIAVFGEEQTENLNELFS